jgi:Tfp pilus assembly protein FimT
MEIAGALLSIIIVLAPSLKGWVDSVSYRNRVQARAALIRAQREQGHDGGSAKQLGKRRQNRG